MMSNNDETFDGFVGGGELPHDRVRQDVHPFNNLVAISALDKQMARLLTLHPDLQVKFRNTNLASLDDQTKEALLQDMQDVLGITPLRNE